MRAHGHARVDPSDPQAFAVCDRCGFWWNRADLRWQYQYRGNSLVSLRLLVCERCLDEPHEFARPAVLPPDPLPIPDPRPENTAAAEGAPPANIAVRQLASGTPLPAPATGLPSPRPVQFAE